jgi:hypothetical protein
VLTEVRQAGNTIVTLSTGRQQRNNNGVAGLYGRNARTDLVDIAGGLMAGDKRHLSGHLAFPIVDIAVANGGRHQTYLDLALDGFSQLDILNHQGLIELITDGSFHDGLLGILCKDKSGNFLLKRL